MAGFMDILGTLVQQGGMAHSASKRMRYALGAGDSSSLNDIIGNFSQMLGGSRSSGQASSSGSTGLGGVLGDALGSLGSNKVVLGGLGTLAGAVLGGRKSSARGALGGGGLAMLAALAFSALQKAGQTPRQPPRALLGPQTSQDEQALEKDAEIIVRAMINAAKADGQIDDEETQKIVGKLQQDGLTEEEKFFFISEAQKPMNMDKVVESSGKQAEMAAQIYAASLLAIEVDTAAEQEYMRQLAQGLGLHPQVVDHIEKSLGL